MSDINSIENVEYRDIPGFPGYRVGSDGSVWSCRRRTEWQQMTPQTRSRSGHKQIGIYNDSGYKMMFVHTLVLVSFVSQRPEGLECCHNDGNPANNHLNNLRWDTRSSNNLDVVKHGRHKGFVVRVPKTHESSKRGEENHFAKLTQEIVKAIRLEYASGAGGYTKLGKKYHVNRTTVLNLVKRRTWKHVP